MARKLDIITLILLILEFIAWLVYMAATGKPAAGGPCISCRQRRLPLPAHRAALPLARRAAPGDPRPPTLPAVHSGLDG